MPRSVWKGSVSVGLVNIPVSLQTAVRESKVSFNQITPCCGSRVSQNLKCKVCGKEVSRKEVKKGWDLGDGKFIVLEQSEIEAMRLKSVKSVGIEGFVPVHLIDPIQMASSYYVVPVEGAEKAYTLITEALFRTGYYALARITTRGKEHIAVMRAKANGTKFYLILTTLYYPDEVLAPPEIPSTIPLSEKERELAKTLLEGYKIEQLDLTKYTNRYIEAMRELINAKLTGQPMPTQVQEAQPAMDLTQALTASVQQKVKA